MLLALGIKKSESKEKDKEKIAIFPKNGTILFLKPHIYAYF